MRTTEGRLRLGTSALVAIFVATHLVGLALATTPDGLWAGDVPAAVEFGRVAAAPVNTLRQQTHRCQEISVCF